MILVNRYGFQLHGERYIDVKHDVEERHARPGKFEFQIQSNRLEIELVGAKHSPHPILLFCAIWGTICFGAFSRQVGRPFRVRHQTCRVRSSVRSATRREVRQRGGRVWRMSGTVVWRGDCQAHTIGTCLVLLKVLFYVLCSSWLDPLLENIVIFPGTGSLSCIGISTTQGI